MLANTVSIASSCAGKFNVGGGAEFLTHNTRGEELWVARELQLLCKVKREVLGVFLNQHTGGKGETCFISAVL